MKIFNVTYQVVLPETVDTPNSGYRRSPVSSLVGADAQAGVVAVLKQNLKLSKGEVIEILAVHQEHGAAEVLTAKAVVAPVAPKPIAPAKPVAPVKPVVPAKAPTAPVAPVVPEAPTEPAK